MVPCLEEKRAALAELCRRYHVARLEVFGSAATGEADAQARDLDFLVDFQAESSMGPFHQYFDFLEELQHLFGRDVDLVERRAMKNPHFIKAVNASRKLLYAA